MRLRNKELRHKGLDLFVHNLWNFSSKSDIDFRYFITIFTRSESAMYRKLPAVKALIHNDTCFISPKKIPTIIPKKLKILDSTLYRIVFFLLIPLLINVA